MLPWDLTGKKAPKLPLPDHVNIVEPKKEIVRPNPTRSKKKAKLPFL